MKKQKDLILEFHGLESYCEAPTLMNVLNLLMFLGNMSTVGPRPYMIGEDKYLEQHIPRYKIRRFVKPGVQVGLQ